MRKFGKDSLKESTIVHQLNMDEEMEKFVDIYVDEKFIVIIYEKFESPDFYKVIQVRSTETLKILQTIRVKDETSMFVIGYIHYSNGILIFGSNQFSSSSEKPQFLKYFITKVSHWLTLLNFIELLSFVLFPSLHQNLWCRIR